MSTISKLAKSNLKTNKSKSALIILTILLTTTLLTSIGLTCLNWSKANREVAIERSGSNHGMYKSVDTDTINIIKNNIDIEKFGIYSSVGFAQNNKNDLAIMYISEHSREMSNLIFDEGKYPEKENEIAVQSEYLKGLGKNIKVGDKISMDYNSRKEEKLKKKEFIVSGIINTSEFNKANKRYSAVISEEFLAKNEYHKDMVFNAHIRVKGEEKLSASEIDYKVKEVANDIGIEKDLVSVNEDYVSATNPDMSVIGGALVIVLLVVISSVIVIYSIFYVSIVAKVKEFGKLRAMGATKKQIRGVILKEGMVLATIAIPLGLLTGWLISDFIIIKLIGLDKYGVQGVSIPLLIGVLVLSYLTVIFSLIRPMIIASKISPVEAMRYNGDEKASKKRKGYNEVTLKRLTYSNIARNKKKTAITLLSLSLSGILFIAMSTIVNSMDAREMATQGGGEDFTLNLTNYEFNEEDGLTIHQLKEKNPLNDELKEKIKNIDGVKSIVIGKDAGATSTVSGEEREYSFGSYDDLLLKELKEKLVDGKIDEEKLLAGKGVVYTFPKYAQEDGIKVGDDITFKLKDGAKTIEKTFEILAISEVHTDEFVIPEKVMDEMFKTDMTSWISVNAKSGKLESVEKALKEISNGNDFIKITSLEEVIASYEMALKMTKTLAYSLATILGIIGFINLINTMVTSIITRKKEIGMLQAIGLSDNQLVKMLQLEGLFYTGGAMFITLTLGNIVGYIAFLLFKNSGASYAVYNYPLSQTLIMIFAVTIAQLTITYLVTENFRKDSLVDRIRYSE